MTSDPLPENTPHYSINFEPGTDGWYPARCNCGWEGGLYPDAEDACDALMDHAAEVAREEST